MSSARLRLSSSYDAVYRNDLAINSEAQLDRDLTLILLALATICAGLARWGDTVRRRRPRSNIALFPWAGLMFVSLVAMLMLVAHVLTLFGKD